MSEETPPGLSERVLRQIERLLDQCEQAISQQDWATARGLAESVLRMDEANRDAVAYLAAANASGTSDPADRTVSDAISVRAKAEASPGPVEAPTSFVDGRYVVERLLGEGGKKRVYLAHDTKLDRDVAFALIKTEGLDDDGRTRIHREAQAMGRLGDHPHIVSVYDIGEEPATLPGHGQPYIVSQLMAGGDVEALIAQAPDHRPPLELTLKIADEVCQALEYAHSKDVIHRDLKPGNVWLTAPFGGDASVPRLLQRIPEERRGGEGTASFPVAKLGDFGLAVALDRSRLTQTGMTVGTVSYMPPEQALGGEVTSRSDLYALGAMLYELVTGRPPFVGDESVAIITQHLSTPPVAPSWHRPDCPPGLEALILRLLDKDPTKRPASAAEVREALAGVQRGSLRGEPVEPHAVAPSPLYRGTFVGREAELRQLQAAFDAAISGDGALVAVVGEPGIGKTALCEQLATYVAIRGGKTLVGHCYEEGSLSLPYLAFVEALRTYVLARDPEGLKQDLGSTAGDVARIVSEIRERVNVEPHPSAGDPEEDRYRLLQAVTNFLRSAATVQPLVLVLEDLHWADRGTLDLLLHLARGLAGSRLLVVATYRDVEVERGHPLSSTLAELRRSTSFQRVPLRGLTVDEVHRMMNIIRGQEVRWSRAEAIYRQTEGNPLFVQEVLRFIVEEGQLVREGGRYVPINDDPEAGIPEGLRDVIGKRLSLLSEKTNQVLTVAAVVGREFRLDVLQGVAGLPEEELYAGLEEATERAVVEERTAVGAIGFRFTHAFFRQTLYEEIFAPRRIRLHQQVGRALEDVHARRLEEHAAELADHFAQSTERDDLEKALRYSELAADRSLAVFAYSEAARHLERALQVQDVLDPDDKAKRCDLLLALGEALMASGEPRRATEQVAAEAVELAEELRDGQRAGAACRIALAGLQRYAGNATYATPEFKQWADRADGYAQPATPDRVYADVALSLAGSGGGAATTAHRAAARRALDLARTLNDPDALFAAALPIIGVGPGASGIDPAALAAEVARAPRAAVSLFALSRCLWFSGAVLFEQGDVETAQGLWRELEALAQRTRDAYVLLREPFIASIRALIDGRLEDAVAAAEALEARADELGSHDYGQTWGPNLAFHPLLHQGQSEEALRRLAGAGDQGGMSQELLGLAVLHREREVRERLQPGTGTPQVVLRSLAAAVALRDAALAEAVASDLVERFPAVVFGPPQQVPFSAARLLGEAAALRGDAVQARQHYEQAIDVCARAHFRPELALSRLALAELLLEHYPDERAKALDHLDFAIKEFEAMKMAPSRDRALALKKSQGD